MAPNDTATKAGPLGLVLVILAIALNATAFVLPGLGAFEFEHAATLSLCITLVGACTLSRRLYTRGVAGPTLMRLYLGSALAYLAVHIVSCCIGPNPPCALLASIAQGLARTYALALVGCLAGALGFRRSTSAILISFALAATLSLICNTVDMPGISTAITLACIVSITGCSAYLGTPVGICDPGHAVESPSSRTPTQTIRLLFESPSVTAITFVATLLFLFVFGLVSYVAESSDIATDALPWKITLAFCYISLAACMFKSTSVYLNAVFFFVYFITVVASACAMFMSVGTEVLYAVTLGGSIFMQVIIQVFAIVNARRYQISIAWMFTALLGTLVAAHLTGRFIAWALLSLAGLDARLAISAGLVLVALAVLVALTIFVVPRSKVPETNPEAWDIPVQSEVRSDRPHAGRDGQAQDPGWDRAFEQLSLNLSLSDKERAIMHPYLQGRSVPVISKRLFLAEPTVRAHISNVYARAGVHSKQGLMDILDSLMDA